MAEKSKVIIIVAGAAGLAAARELASSGKEVIVLEARNRIGSEDARYPFVGNSFDTMSS